MARLLQSHTELRVYQDALKLAMTLYEVSATFPKAARYALTDQVRRSSRSVCANLAEAWRKRRYKAAFISKLSDAEAEAAETQVWIEIAFRCGHIDQDSARALYSQYNRLLRTLVGMIFHAERWILK